MANDEFCCYVLTQLYRPNSCFSAASHDAVGLEGSVCDFDRSMEWYKLSSLVSPQATPWKRPDLLLPNYRKVNYFHTGEFMSWFLTDGEKMDQMWCWRKRRGKNRQRVIRDGWGELDTLNSFRSSWMLSFCFQGGPVRNNPAVKTPALQTHLTSTMKSINLEQTVCFHSFHV